MENIILLTIIAVSAMFFLYYMDGKLSDKDRSMGDYIKTGIIMSAGTYLALKNHTIPKQVFKEVIEAGPATF